ncbi:MAG: hypothetical protein H6736_02290 [Alphaproteobacteria bacterium]|nr:hypothetical protein [Alphaproteobacteria bacterium]MCB9690620.1 hypothetical protein [Alphaproteobacteria bacterium]
MSWSLSLLVPLLLGLLWHGFSLKVAVALAGEQSPGFFRAAWVSWLGGLLGAVAMFTWSWTVGFAVALFLSAWLAAAVGFGIQFLTTATIYKRGLKLSMADALGVTGIHLVLSLVVNAVLGWLTYSML